MGYFKYSHPDKKGLSTKIVPLLVTVLLITLLVLAGPASAFSFSFLGLSDSYAENQKIVFTTSVNINSNERLPLSSLDLNIDSSSVCSFNIDGSPISSCDNISITLLSSGLGYGYGYGYADFKGYSYNFPLGYNYGYSNGFGSLGYGYGYGDVSGKLVYKVEITMPHSSLPVGNHSISISASADSETFTSDEMNVQILPVIPINSCQTLSSSGFYSLQNDVYSEGVCFNITSSDVSLDANGHSINYLLLGDMNGDGVFDSSDTEPFILAMSHPSDFASSFPDANILAGDFNSDGLVNVQDINGFTARLDSSVPCLPRTLNESVKGDINLDGWIDSIDTDLFIYAISHSDFYSVYPNTNLSMADFNSDGLVNVQDINGFTAALESSDKCTYYPDSRNNSVGISASSVSGIEIKNARIYEFEKGILFENVSDSLVSNVDIFSNHSLGVQLIHSSDNSFESLVLSEALNPQVSLFDSSQNNVCLDCSYSDSEYVESGSEWTRVWSLSLLLTDGSSPIDGARVKAYDVFSSLHFDRFTSPSGSISETLPEYLNTGTIKNYNNYNLEISKAGYATQVVPLSLTAKTALSLTMSSETGSGESTSINNGNGGGRSRGSDNGETTCYVGWTCTDWSVCSIEGSQTRTCSPSASGLCLSSSLEKPAELQSCTPESTIVIESESPGFLSRITGAVVGALGSPSIYIPLAFIIALAILYGYTVYKRKKK